MNLVVITSGSYPYGEAATNRHLSYLKGLADLGVNIKLLILQPSYNQSSKSNRREGSFNKIDFEYMYWFTGTDTKFKKKYLAKIFSHYYAVKRLKSILKIKNNIILVLNSRTYDIIPYNIISKLYNTPIYHECTEFPFLNVNTILKTINLWIYQKYLIPKFDGIFVISKALVKYFQKFMHDKNKILHLPMTVEYERFFDNHEIVLEYGSYIAYCGSMYTDKDGVPDLIRAFNYVCSKVDSINFLLIGENKDKNKFRHISQVIDSSPYKDRIFCIGRIERDEIPKYLNNAEVLALARPDNIQAKGGFPTKLGEYLSTGNPVVITDVGEHSEYLKDEVSAFIAPPNNPLLFGEKFN